MPRPTHRLDLLLVPHDRSIGQGKALLQRLVDDGVATPAGEAGPAATDWVRGGFARVRLDDPGHDTLYANRLGGFRVACPAKGGNLVPAFARAMTRWRAGGPRELAACPVCGRAHDLADLVFRPHAAFGRWAIVFADVGHRAPSAEASAVIADLLGPVEVVLRR